MHSTAFTALSRFADDMNADVTTFHTLHPATGDTFRTGYVILRHTFGSCRFSLARFSVEALGDWDMETFRGITPDDWRVDVFSTYKRGDHAEVIAEFARVVAAESANL